MKQTLTWNEQKEESLKAIKLQFEALTSDLKTEGVLQNASYDVKINNNVIQTKVCFDAQVKTSVMAVAGKSYIEVSGCAEASSAPPVYVSVYAFVDASGSMGIGASTDDQRLMNRKLGCAFACHTLDWKTPMFNPDCENRGNWDDGSKTTTCARKIGAKTRFDVVRGALADVIDDAGAMAKMPNQFRFAIYKFSNTLTEVQSETTNLGVAKAAVQSMEMDIAGAGSNFREGMKALLPKIPTSGDGKTPSTPKVILLIMTDGVEGNVKEYRECRNAWLNGVWTRNICNYWGSWNPDNAFTVNEPGFYWGSERSQAIDSKICDNFKSKGVTVSTLNTEYVTPPGSNDTRFQQIQSMLRPVIRQTMAKCASREEYAYYATTPGEIQRATDMMFRSVLEKARITR
ncbi:MAG: VWA domain-containing protein [Beijerinckiaceae bacterium]|nr:VWA domain-containing protein [Beijerinckiaceae bacterium]